MIDWIASPAPAGEVSERGLGGSYPQPAERGTSGRRPDDARTEELDNLRLAMATFALQLDAFEIRVAGQSSSAPSGQRFSYGSAMEELIGRQ
jgi:hypothetical protein